jgi:hypothetical protein
MSTTQTYLHLAGVVFHDEAKRFEERFASPSPEVGTGIGTDLREPHRI